MTTEGSPSDGVGSPARCKECGAVLETDRMYCNAKCRNKAWCAVNRPRKTEKVAVVEKA